MNNIEPSSSFQKINSHFKETNEKVKKKDKLSDSKLKNLDTIKNVGSNAGSNKASNVRLSSKNLKSIQTPTSKEEAKIHRVREEIAPQIPKVLAEVFQIVDNLIDKSVEEKGILKNSLKGKFMPEVAERMRRQLDAHISVLNEKNKKDDHKYLLARGVKLDRLVRMEVNQSAGREMADRNALAPTEEEVIKQVRESGDLPELTTKLSVAERFGRRGAVCIVEIEGKYLTYGSKAEEGWVAAHNAPAEIKGWYVSEEIGYHFER